MNFREENAEIRTDLFACERVRTLSKKSLDRESVQELRRLDRFWPFFGVFRCPVFDSFTQHYIEKLGKKKPTKNTLFWVHKNNCCFRKSSELFLLRGQIDGLQLTGQGGMNFSENIILFPHHEFSLTLSLERKRYSFVCGRAEERTHTRARTKIWHHHRKTTLRNEARRTTTRAPGRRNRSSPRTRSL